MPYKDSSDPRKAEKVREYEIKSQYGLTMEQYRTMQRVQGGKCAICYKAMRVGGKPGMDQEHIDHCHTTGVVRGLLCSRCNSSIGKFEDNPDLLIAAAGYLMAHRYVMPGE